MSGQRLLADYEQWIAFRASDCVRKSIVQLGFVRIVCVRGSIVLRNHSNIVRSNAESCQITHELRLSSTHACSQSTQARSRNRSVNAVSVGVNETNHTSNRQAKLQSNIAARNQNRTAALCFKEASTSAIVCAREESWIDALRIHFFAIGSCVHIAEANYGFHADIVNCASYYEVSFAESNLVDAFFERNRCSCACRHRLNHISVAADIGLHYVSCNNVWKRLLQYVRRNFVVKEAIQVQFAH
ncbi:Uncharacterised protein [Chlamydia trachomatis]|nr:Uncharacterised protein [Chlamydia trachomatis]